MPAQKNLFTGGIITENRDHPLIHLKKAGSSEGWIKSIKGLLQLDVQRYDPVTVMNREAIEKMLNNAEIER